MHQLMLATRDSNDDDWKDKRQGRFKNIIEPGKLVIYQRPLTTQRTRKVDDMGYAEEAT